MPCSQGCEIRLRDWAIEDGGFLINIDLSYLIYVYIISPTEVIEKRRERK